MKVLVCEDEEDIREFVAMILESEFDLEVLEAQSGAQGIEFLKNDSDIAFVVSDYNMPNGTGGDVYNYVKSEVKIPFIHLSTEKISGHPEFENFFDEHKGNKVLEKPCSPDDIISVSQEILKIIGNDKAGDSLEGSFRKIKIEKYQKYNSIAPDVFLRLSDEKFVKITSKGVPLDEEKIQDYIEKNVDYFYLKENCFKSFAENILQKLNQSLIDDTKKGKEALGDQFRLIQEIQELVIEIGITEGVIKLTDRISESVFSEVNNNKLLKDYLNKIINQNNYKSEHTFLVNYICGAICRELEWDSNTILKRLVYASMFCDFSLEDKLAKIHLIDSKDFSELELNDRKKIKNHISEVIKFLENNDYNLKDEIEIIRNHHEKPNGRGFPRGLTNKNIPLVSSCFILAYDFAHLLVLNKNESKESQINLINKFDSSYSEGNFAKPYNALKKILQKN